jgi:hypothetical protein
VPTQTENGQQGGIADTTTEQTHATTDTATQPVGLMVQLARQGLDISLRSVQAWGDLARQICPTALGSPANPAMISLAYDLFEKLLAAQRQVVDELVATQRQLAQQLFDTADHRPRR